MPVESRLHCESYAWPARESIAMQRTVRKGRTPIGPARAPFLHVAFRPTLWHPAFGPFARRIMSTKRKITLLGAICLIAALCVPAQQQPARDDTENVRV